MSDPLRRLSHAIEHRLHPTGLIVLAGLVFVGAVTAVALGGGGGSKQATSTTTTTSTAITLSSTPTRAGIEGFPPVGFSITPAGQTAPRDFCGLLAENAEQLSKGLMNRRDLGGYDGMIFRFAADTGAAFYMANVLIPLSIAWFDAGGVFVSATDMAPCTVEAGKCPLYRATGRYRYALEVPGGGLGALGAGPGSTLSLGGSTCI